MGMIQIDNLHKSFDGLAVLNGIHLSVEKGTTAVILGRSGTGKSVLLKCIVGLLAPDSGNIRVDGEEVIGLESNRLNALRKRMGFLFQGAALYDSMSVRDNLAFPLRRNTTLTEDEIEPKVAGELEKVGLSEFVDKMPSQLSGGMRKRVGLARSLITDPEFMLYDEPTTGLDPITSREISSLILKLGRKHNITSVAVTHDMICARTIADKVAVLENGIIRYEGTIDTMEQANNAFVQSFFMSRRSTGDD
jgi:phospholipid/cholesterol/gamma-HCH transport system ATP-binding protein